MAKLAAVMNTPETKVVEIVVVGTLAITRRGAGTQSRQTRRVKSDNSRK